MIQGNIFLDNCFIVNVPHRLFRPISLAAHDIPFKETPSDVAKHMLSKY